MTSVVRLSSMPALLSRNILIRERSSTAFVAKRKEYQNQISDLRKAWQIEYELKQQRERERKAEELKAIIQSKAVLLRAKREQAVLRRIATEKERQRNMMLYRERLEKMSIIRKQQQEEQNQINKRLIENLEHESSVWITLDNLEQKINTDLFKRQSTTGIVTKNSEHWRPHVLTFKVERYKNPAFLTAYYNPQTLVQRMELEGQGRMLKKIMVQDFLDPMVGTGEDRLKYNEYVEKFTESFDDVGAFDEVDSYIKLLTSGRDSDNSYRARSAEKEAEGDVFYDEDSLNGDGDVDSVDLSPGALRSKLKTAGAKKAAELAHKGRKVNNKKRGK